MTNLSHQPNRSSRKSANKEGEDVEGEIESIERPATSGERLGEIRCGAPVGSSRQPFPREILRGKVLQTKKRPRGPPCASESSEISRLCEELQANSRYPADESRVSPRVLPPPSPPPALVVLTVPTLPCAYRRPSSIGTRNFLATGELLGSCPVENP